MPIIERRTKAGVGGALAATIAAAIFAPHLARAQELIPREHQVRLSPDEAGLRLREPTGITAEHEKLELGALGGPKSFGLNGVFVLKTGEGDYHPAVWLGKNMYLVTGAGEKMKLQEIKAGTVSAGVGGKLPAGFRYGAQVTGQYGSQAGVEARAGAGFYGKVLDINAMLSTQALQGSVDWHLGPKTDLSTIFSNRNAAVQFSQTIDALKTRLQAGVARDWEVKNPRGTAQLRAIFNDWIYVHGGVDFMGGTGTHGAGTYVGAGVNVPLDVSKWKWGGAKAEPVTIAPKEVEKPKPVTAAQVEALKQLAMLGYEPRGTQGKLLLREPNIPGGQPWKLSKEELLKNQINLTMAQMVGAKGAGKRQLQQKLNSLNKEFQAIQAQKANAAKQAAKAERQKLAAEKQQAAVEAAAEKRKAAQEKFAAQKAAAAEKKRAAEEKRLLDIQKKKDDAQRRKLEREQKKKGEEAPLPLEPLTPPKKAPAEEPKGKPPAAGVGPKPKPTTGLFGDEEKGIIAGVAAGKAVPPREETKEERTKRLKEEAADALIASEDARLKKEAEERRRREEERLALKTGEGEVIQGGKKVAAAGVGGKGEEAKPEQRPEKKKPAWMPPHVKQIKSVKIMEQILLHFGVKIKEVRDTTIHAYGIGLEDAARGMKVPPIAIEGADSGWKTVRENSIKRFYLEHLRKRLDLGEPLHPEEVAE